MKSKISRSLLFRLRRFSSIPSLVIPSVARDLLFLLALVLAASLSLVLSAGAQQARNPDLRLLQAYTASREVSLVGTVVKYDTASSVPPMGAHVLVQTASGQVDVHLGNAKVLAANHLQLNAGDNVRIVGEPMALGDSTYFAARIVQKGLQAVAVRNARGFLVTSASTLTEAQKDALRGVR
jgi:anti-sigma factor RsiW